MLATKLLVLLACLLCASFAADVQEGNNLQQAIDSAANGDRIILRSAGRQFNSASFTINKALTFVGGPNTVFQCGSTQNPVFRVTGQTVAFDSISFTGCFRAFDISGNANVALNRIESEGAVESAVVANGQATLSVSNSSFTGGSAVAGAALSVRGSGQTSVSATNFLNNQGQSGGAVFVGGSASITLEKINATGNVGENGGFMYINNTAAEVYGSFFLSNGLGTPSPLTGGGVFFVSGSGSLLIDSSEIHGGAAPGSGGIIYASGSYDVPKEQGFR
eukprot:Colp12_sorted_trinity150504_noHs@26347